MTLSLMFSGVWAGSSHPARNMLKAMPSSPSSLRPILRTPNRCWLDMRWCGSGISPAFPARGKRRVWCMPKPVDGGTDCRVEPRSGSGNGRAELSALGDQHAAQRHVFYQPVGLQNTGSRSTGWRARRAMIFILSRPGHWPSRLRPPPTGQWWRSLILAWITCTGSGQQHMDQHRENPTNGLDNDGDGFINDYYGYDFADTLPDPMDPVFTERTWPARLAPSATTTWV